MGISSLYQQPLARHKVMTVGYNKKQQHLELIVLICKPPQVSHSEVRDLSARRRQSSSSLSSQGGRSRPIFPECTGSVCQHSTLSPDSHYFQSPSAQSVHFFLSMFDCCDGGTSGATGRQWQMVSAPPGSVCRQSLVLPGHA